jgi:hypothetical protein
MLDRFEVRLARRSVAPMSEPLELIGREGADNWLLLHIT